MIVASYPAVHRHQCVVIHRSPVIALYGADHRGTQQLEDGVVFAILQQIHGVPRHRVIHRKHKVQHVLLHTSEDNGAASDCRLHRYQSVIM